MTTQELLQALSDENKSAVNLSRFSTLLVPFVGEWKTSVLTSATYTKTSDVPQMTININYSYIYGDPNGGGA